MPPSGLCPLIFGLRPDQGHSPDKFLVALPAGRSPASHRAAKPERKAPNSFRTRCLAFQDFKTALHKKSGITLGYSQYRER